MYVVFISNCQKVAWSRTRALLDRYATRIGERAWGTPITEQALDEVRAALRRRASRNTSVACYRNDPVFGMKMVWVVGNRNAYDSEERFAVGFREKKAEFPQYLRWAALCAELAGLAHDLGKMNNRFQQKIRQTKRDKTIQKDAVRHEWLSAHLFNILINDESFHEDRSWLPSDLVSAWKRLPGRVSHRDLERPPVKSEMRCLTDAVAWAICTHHGAIGGTWNETEVSISHTEHVRGGEGFEENTTLASVSSSDDSPTFTITSSDDENRWKDILRKMKVLASRLRSIACSDPALLEKSMLVARACLVLADHKISSIAYQNEWAGECKKKSGFSLIYANTKKTNNGKSRYLDQPLSWHLQKVGDLASRNARMFSGDLPAINSDLAASFLAKRSEDPRYIWQDRAADSVSSLRGGKLVFNVASTGAGKTLGNLKIALAMRPKGSRLAVAFNLRTLTRQTFEAYRKGVGPSNGFDSNFACLLGYNPSESENFMDDDEESAELQQIEDDLEGADDLEMPEWLNDIATRHSSKRLASIVAVPALISTMDWIVAAGEPGEQERHALALIRLATSDLILDEVDSYDVEATVAVMRVVRIAAMFGRNVIVSSATLNPALADGIIRAYESGWKSNADGCKQWNLVTIHDASEFRPAIRVSPSPDEGIEGYRDDMKRIAGLISSRPAMRRMKVCQVEDLGQFHQVVMEQSLVMHDRHAFRPEGLNCNLSIGLIRMANVNPCMDMAEFLRISGKFVVCAYHANEVLERRKWRESLLDAILSRKRGDDWVEALVSSHPWIADCNGDVRLVVVATPVEEVGRDHDFDWAIIEPSSMHSIIQTAGRVNRHRQTVIEHGNVNVAILSRNLRDLSKPSKRCFEKPGLECEKHDGSAMSTHAQHDLRELLRPAVGGEVPEELDARLVFDEGGRKSMFAACDEDGVSVKTRYAMPVIAGSGGMRSGLMLADFVNKFRLRGGARPVFYKIFIDEYKFLKVGKEVESDKAKSSRSGGASNEAIPENTWLCDTADSFAKNGAVHATFDSYKNIRRIIAKWNGLVAITAD